MKLDKTFEVNGKAYQTDEETLDLLTKLHNNSEHGQAELVFSLCKMTGRIKEIN